MIIVITILNAHPDVATSKSALTSSIAMRSVKSIASVAPHLHAAAKGIAPTRSYAKVIKFWQTTVTGQMNAFLSCAINTNASTKLS
jgi:hypothetical protein